MGLFERNKRQADAVGRPAAQGIARLGPGRRIRSSEGFDSAFRTLCDVVESYGPRQYAELPRLVAAGWDWSGTPSERPDAVFSGTMQDGYPGFATLRTTPAGTEAGVYDLAGEMTLPLIGQWKQRDPSLTSIGQVEAGLALTAPPVPGDYVEELVGRLGLEPTDQNRTSVAADLRQGFILKAVTFMQNESPSVADRFIQDHSQAPLGVDGLSQILHSLAHWKVGVIPYIQDVPPRVRAVVLEARAAQESM